MRTTIGKKSRAHLGRDDRIDTMPELANPVFYALADRQAAFGEHRGAAHRFDPDVAPFTALPDEPTSDDWDALRHLVGPGGGAFMLREPLTIPDGWEPLWQLDAVQMIADESVTSGDEIDAVPLTSADVPEMIELVRADRAGTVPAADHRARHATSACASTASSSRWPANGFASRAVLK